MNIHDIFPTRFVKAHDLGDKEVTVTIKDATMEDMGHGAEKETKLCLWFEKATKGFVLNKTNAMIIASLYGPETDAWLGKQITIFAARVKAFGTWQDAVRVKEQIPARNVNRQPMPDTMQEPPPIDDENDLLDVDEGQNAPQTTQTHAGATNGNGTLDSATRSVDASTGEITNSYAEPRYAHLIDKLTGDCLERANRARRIHAQSRGAASPDQYRFLAGTIDDIVRQDGGHRAVLEVFVGRVVNGDNPPGTQLAGKLLDALLEYRMVESDGEKVKAANPDFKPDAVACVHSIYSLIREADGQTTLFEQEPQAEAA